MLTTLLLWSLVQTTPSTSLARWVRAGSTGLSVMLCICMVSDFGHLINSHESGRQPGWLVCDNVTLCMPFADGKQAVVLDQVLFYLLRTYAHEKVRWHDSVLAMPSKCH